MTTMRLMRNDATERVSLRDDPAYAAADDRLQQLKACVAGLERERERLLYASPGDDVERDLDRRAAALLEGGELEANGESPQGRLRHELEEVSAQLRVARRAVEMQTAAVAREALRVGSEIRARLAPEHRAIVRRVYDALQQLNVALVEEERFRERLVVADVPLHELVPMPLKEARLDVEYTAAWRWEKEAREAGLI